jgi:CDP-diacylglycerol--glycerol-3-phosphate 3-phosphatidyltransferase
MKLKYIPNILSGIRIALVGVFIYLYFLDYPNNIVWALVTFIAAGATDVLDGYLARRNNWVTNLGKVLDPLADKLMQCTVLICMTVKDLIPVWLVIPFILKEVLVLLGGMLVSKKMSKVVMSNVFGKMTVVFFYIAIFVCMLARDFLAENVWLLHLISTAVLAAALAALVNYTVAALKAMKNAKAEEPVAEEPAAKEVN